MFILKLGKLKSYLIVIIVNLVSLLSGLMLAWAPPILPKLSTSNNPLGRQITSTEQSWIVSLAYLGGVLGPPLSGFIMDKFGRKPAIACVHLPNIASSILAAFGNNIWYFYAARFLAGMSIYSGISIAAVYFGEVAEVSRRGLLYSITSIFINLGTLSSYCISSYTSIKVFNLILLAIALVGMTGTWVFVVESPYFLIQKLRFEEAKSALIELRDPNTCGDIEIQKELNVIQKYVSNKVPSERVASIVKSKVARKAFLMSLVVTIMQQFSGIIIIYSYTQPIFQKSGSSLAPEISFIIVEGSQFVTICLTSFGVDYLGRKRMLCISSAGLAFTLALLGTFFNFQSFDKNITSEIDWLPLVCLIFFFIFFNSGLGGVPFLYMSEIFPTNIKSIGTSIVMAIYCLIGFVVTYSSNRIAEDIEASGMFFIFSGCMGIFCIYVFIVLFETRGMNLQDIQKRLGRSTRSKNAFETTTESEEGVEKF